MALFIYTGNQIPIWRDFLETPGVLPLMNACILGALDLSHHTSTLVDWTDPSGLGMRITGTGMVPIVSGNALTGLKGAITGLTLNRPDTPFGLTISGLANVDGATFLDLFNNIEVLNRPLYDLSNLFLTGNDQIFATVLNDTVRGYAGNDLISGDQGNDRLIGEAGKDTLVGGAGDDTLIGNDGADRFVFAFDPGHMGVDTIVDFKPHRDHIQLDLGTFTNIGDQGVLNAIHFGLGSVAATRKQGILYDSGSGDIYADADGRGPEAAVKFAHVDPGTLLTAADFLVV